LNLLWGAPFLGVLLSVALGPSLAPRAWHRRLGIVALFWSAALLLPWAWAHGPAAAVRLGLDALLLSYLPFVTVLLALYAAGGGVLVRGGPGGTPAGNTALLAAGMAMGVVMGQAGAAMVVINPLLHANAHRRRKVHLVLFLVVLVANASGALVPLGNPPLYIGFLQGVPFAWPAQHLIAPLAVLTALTLGAFYVTDRALARAEPPAPAARRLHVRGWRNVGLILLTAAIVVMQNVVRLGTLEVFGVAVPAMRLVAVAGFLLVTAASVVLTPNAVRQQNDFSWAPMSEVALLFVAIFITIEPVLAMLAEGLSGPLAPVLRLTLGPGGAARPVAFFWLAGILSAFLDNAPTYLVFFKIAQPDPAALTGVGARTLAALSAGAVFFGALTYIGNAPNMMVRGIAAHRGVRMPGFFAFTALASAVLLPVFVLLTLVFFR